MPDILDIFNDDAFGVVSLTNLINKRPYQPGRIGSMGLYQSEGISTSTAVIREQFGTLRLIPATGRGAEPSFARADKARVRSLEVPHLPHGDALYADEIINARLYGEDIGGPSPAGLAQTMQTKMDKLVAQHNTTWEHHMLGSIKGVLLDSDGTTEIYNWFTEFGITKKAITWTTATDSLAQICRDIKRHMAQALGSLNNDGNVMIHCFVGADFMDAIANDSTVKSDYQRWRDGERLRDNAAFDQFVYQGVAFEEYLGYYDATTSPWIADNMGYAFPLGTDRFKRYNAPADTVDAIGSIGMPMYAYQERKKGNKGIDICTQSNPLFICTQPGVLVELTVVTA